MSPFLFSVSGISLGLLDHLFMVRKAGVMILILATLLSCSVCFPLAPQPWHQPR